MVDSSVGKLLLNIEGRSNPPAPSVGGFPRHVQWTCLGNIFHGFEVPSSVLFFPDMFIEHVWETFWYHGGTQRGVHFPDMFIKNTKKNSTPFFFLMGVVRVMVGLGVWSSNTTLFHDEKLAFFGLEVRIYPKFLDCFGFSLNFEILGFWRPPRSDSGGPGGDGTRSLHQVFYPHFLKKMEMSLPTTSKNPFSMFFI